MRTNADMAAKAKRGRPPVREAEKKGENINIRLTAEQKAELTDTPERRLRVDGEWAGAIPSLEPKAAHRLGSSPLDRSPDLVVQRERRRGTCISR